MTGADSQRELIALLIESGPFSRDIVSGDSQIVLPMGSAALNLAMGGLVLADPRAPVALPAAPASNAVQGNPGDLASSQANTASLREMINSLIEASPVNVQLSRTREASTSAHYIDPTIGSALKTDKSVQQPYSAQPEKENWAVNTVKSVLSAVTEMARAIKEFFRGG
jgi:hypothetical protein